MQGITNRDRKYPWALADTGACGFSPCIEKQDHTYVDAFFEAGAEVRWASEAKLVFETLYSVLVKTTGDKR